MNITHTTHTYEEITGSNLIRIHFNPIELHFKDKIWYHSKKVFSFFEDRGQLHNTVDTMTIFPMLVIYCFLKTNTTYLIISYMTYLKYVNSVIRFKGVRQMRISIYTMEVTSSS